MAAGSINSIVSATTQLGGSSADFQGAVESHTGGDKVALEGGLEDTIARVKAIFDNRRVDYLTYDRLTRIAYEVMSGQRTMDDVRASVDWLQSQGIDTYDRGGRWPSGTLALNMSGHDEYVLTPNQMRSFRGGKGDGDTLTIENGAINITIEGNAGEGTPDQIKEAIQEALDEIWTQFRSN